MVADPVARALLQRTLLLMVRLRSCDQVCRLSRKGSRMKKQKKQELYEVEVRWVKGTKRDNLPGWWEVSSGEGTRPFSNKLNAVKYGRLVAKSRQPSSLIIYDQKHRHQSERTYPRSRDPRRSKG